MQGKDVFSYAFRRPRFIGGALSRPPLSHLLDDIRRGVARDKGDAFDLPARPQYHNRSKELIFRPVSTFDVDIGHQLLIDLQGILFIKNDHTVHTTQGRKHFCPHFLRLDRPLIPLNRSD